MYWTANRCNVRLYLGMLDMLKAVHLKLFKMKRYTNVRLHFEIWSRLEVKVEESVVKIAVKEGAAAAAAEEVATTAVEEVATSMCIRKLCFLSKKIAS